MLTWQIGDVTVTKILEAEGQQELAMFPEATREKILQAEWLRPHFADEDGNIYGSVHALVIQTPERRIVVDTCCGNGKSRSSFPPAHMMQTAFLSDLTAAGFIREQIDTVLCTHLHVDHVGWNTMLVDDRWIPTFPNARYLIARAEFAQWQTQGLGFDEEIFADSIKPIFDAGLVDLVETDAHICEEVRLVPTPGHTKGHVSVHIQSKGEEAIITGDFMHSPCQLAWPQWSTVFDDDADIARETREAMLAKVAGQPVLVIGTHFPTPTAGHILRDGSAYRLSQPGTASAPQSSRANQVQASQPKKD